MNIIQHSEANSKIFGGLSEEDRETLRAAGIDPDCDKEDLMVALAKMDKAASILAMVLKQNAGAEIDKLGANLSQLIERVQAASHVETSSDSTLKKDKSPANMSLSAPEDKVCLMDRVTKTVTHSGKANTALCDLGSVKLGVGKGSHKNDVTTIVSMDMGEKVQFLQRPDPESWTVHDAIVTQIDAQIRAGERWNILPLGTIAKTLYGNGRDKISATDIDEIEKRIDRLAGYRVKVDFTDEMQARGAKGKRYTLKDSIVSGSILEAEVNGKIVKALKLHALPPLYDYANATKKIQRVHQQYIQGGPKRKTAKSLAIRDYLIDRILSMYRESKLQRTILFASLAEHLSIDISKSDDKALNNRNKLAKKRLIDSVVEWLNSWTADGTQFIRSYEIVKSGRDRTGVKIELNPKFLKNIKLITEKPAKDKEDVKKNVDIY